MQYPVELREDDGFIVVRFPDIPEAHTQGKDQKEALKMAREALALSMEFYIDDQRPVPAPSKPKRGQQVVELPASVAVKVLLLNEMLAQKIRPIDLARRLEMTPSEVTRLISLKHTSKIDGIASALKVLGKTLEVRAV